MKKEIEKKGGSTRRQRVPRGSSVDRETFDEGDLAWRIMELGKLDPPRLSRPRGGLLYTLPTRRLLSPLSIVRSLLYISSRLL